MDLLDDRFVLTEEIRKRGFRVVRADAPGGQTAIVYSVDGGVTSDLVSDFAEHHDDFMQAFPHHMGRKLLVVYDIRKLDAAFGFDSRFDAYVACCKRNAQVYKRCVLCVLVITDNEATALVVQTILTTLYTPSRPTKVLGGMERASELTAQLWARPS